MGLPTGPAKVCVVCGEDCSNRPRTKDNKGRYYCSPCYEKAIKHTAEKREQAQRAPVSSATPKKRAAPAVAPAHAADDLLRIDDSSDGGAFARIIDEISQSSPSGPAASVNRCSGCGQSVDAQAVICIHCGMNLRSGKRATVQTRSARPKGSRQAKTTVLGVIATVLGALGLTCVAGGLMLAVSIADQMPEFRTSEIVSSALSIVSKLGLLATGVLMLMRHRAALPLAIGTCLFSVSLSSFDFFNSILPSLSRVKSESAAYDAGYQVGSVGGYVLITAIVIAIYWVIISHLRSNQTKSEFGT